MEPIRHSWLAGSIWCPAVQSALSIRLHGSVQCVRGEFRFHGTSRRNTARRFLMGSSGLFLFACLRPLLCVPVRRGDLRRECPRHQRGVRFLHLRVKQCWHGRKQISQLLQRSYLCSAARSLICVSVASSVAQAGAIYIHRAVGRVVVTNCRFERNRIVTAVRMRFVRGC